MTGKPEHRSLDEVKRLLRSLEETPADDTLAPPPKAASPVQRDSEPKSLSVVTPASSPPPMPADQTSSYEAPAEPRPVALAPLKARARPESLVPSTPAPTVKSSSGRMIAGVALAVGAAGVAGIALWQSGDGGRLQRTTPTAATVTTASTRGDTTSARDTEQTATDSKTKAAGEKSSASAPPTGLNAVSAVSPTATPTSISVKQPDPPQPTAKAATGPDTPLAIKSDVSKIATPETQASEPVRLAQAAPPPERGTTAALPPPIAPAVPPRAEENRPVLRIPPQAPPVAQTPAAVEPVRPPAPAPAPLSPPAGMSDASRLDDAELAKLIQDGRTQLDNGNVATARLLFRRAAESGSGEAARLLGDTYDPAKLYAMGVRGTSGDMERAIHWYERADELGDPLAKARLAPLGTR